MIDVAAPCRRRPANAVPLIAEGIDPAGQTGTPLYFSAYGTGR